MTVSTKDIERQSRRKLAFRSWLEADVGNLIRNEASPGYNEAVVDQFVKASTNVAVATSLTSKFLALGRGFVFEILKAPISNHLLIATDERLGEALTVFDSQGANFRFKDGDVKFRFPPVLFTREDRVLFKSIVIHELQHAEDWINGTLQSHDSYEFDLEKYVANVSEARALHGQLRYLLKRIGDVEGVVKLLSGVRPGATDRRNSPFAMNDELIPIAREFLAHFAGVGEGFSPPDVDLPQRPATVYNQRQGEAGEAASAVMKVVGVFLFSQYVRAPGKK